MPVGRPKLPEGKVKKQLVMVRMTDAEKQAVESRAIASGMDTSDYIRSKLTPSDATVSFTWNSGTEVSVTAEHMTYETWRTLKGVIEAMEPERKAK